MKLRLLFCLIGCALVTAPHAQNYPAKPVRLIVPWPAGGTTDILGRVIGQKLNEAWGQPVVIENRGGAAGNIGTELVVKAPPDGYVLLFGNMGTHATNQFMYSGMTFDPVADLAPISLIANVGTVLVVHPNLPVKNVKELVALAKKRPGQLDFASGGVGSFNQLCAELLKMETGINIVHVPYRGTGPALIALIAAEVHLMFPSAGGAMPHVRSGKLRGLAVTSAQPSALAPGLPTVAASGLQGYESTTIYAMFVPAKTPATIINRLNQEIVQILKSPDSKDRLIAGGVEAIGSSPEQLASTVKADVSKWGKLIKELGIRAE